MNLKSRWKKYFKGKGSLCYYTYDFRMTREVEIILEKILEQDPDVFYPRCMKVMRKVPREYSDDLDWEDDVDIFDSQFGLEGMNEGFQLMTFSDDGEVQQSSGNTAFPTWTWLLDLTETFKENKP